MSVLADLAHELGTDPESLRDALFAGDESLQPTYLSVAADGSVTALFTGHVQAGGLDLIADDTAGLLNDDRKIRWHVGDYTGPVVAQISDFESTGILDQAELKSMGRGANLAIAIMRATASDNTDARIQALASPGGSASVVVATDLGGQRTLFDNLQGSDYHQRYATTAMALVPAWSNVGAPWATARIAGTSKNSTNPGAWIHLGGAVAGTGGGTFIDNCTNYGYRAPVGQEDFICGSSIGAVTIRVDAAGNISYPAGGAIARINLDSVSWVSA